MKVKKFDVVKLNNDYNAAILDVVDRNTYFAEIVDKDGKTVDKKNINESDIKEVIYAK